MGASYFNCSSYRGDIAIVPDQSRLILNKITVQKRDSRLWLSLFYMKCVSFYNEILLLFNNYKKLLMIYLCIVFSGKVFAFKLLHLLIMWNFWISPHSIYETLQSRAPNTPSSLLVFEEGIMFLKFLKLFIIPWTELRLEEMKISERPANEIYLI